MSAHELVKPASVQGLLADDLTAVQLGESLPYLLVSLLERRYLSPFQPQSWRVEAHESGQTRPLLREVTSLGRPADGNGRWAQAMPHVLSACYGSGHVLVMALHGEGNHHHLHIGGRRISGVGAGSTVDYLDAEESAFKAYYPGLQMGSVRKLDLDGLPAMAELLETAPVFAVPTGIPSGRGGPLPLQLQSLDHLVRAVGNQRYVAMVVAEPLAPGTVDQTLDTCRRLKSEVHAHIRRTVSRAISKSESESTSEREGIGNAGLLLLGVTSFLQVTGMFAHVAPLTQLARAPIGFMMYSLQATQKSGHQTGTSTSRSESGQVELLNANAEACQELLDQHIRRLQSARSVGWWRTAVYVAAEEEAALERVTAALRSLCSGDATSLDPIRTLTLPPAIVLRAMQHGQVLDMHPAEGNIGHPLGAAFDALATCVNSEELSVLVNLPQRELPGLPMRDVSEFALSAPEPIKDAIELGALQDGLGRYLDPVTVSRDALNRHVFVTGITGYGKTNTCMQILLEAHRRLETPFLVVEPAKTEYRQLVQAAQLQDTLRVYSIGGTFGLPLRLNPLAPVPGISLARHVDLLKAVFNASFPMFAGMPYVLEKAILDVYQERGWSLFTSENVALGVRSTLDERSALTPNLQELHDKVEAVLQRKRYGQEIHQNMGAALRARLNSLMVGNKGAALNTRRPTPLEHLFAAPAVIELQNLGDDEEKAFVMALFFTLLCEYAEARQGRSAHPGVAACSTSRSSKRHIGCYRPLAARPTQNSATRERRRSACSPTCSPRCALTAKGFSSLTKS